MQKHAFDSFFDLVNTVVINMINEALIDDSVEKNYILILIVLNSLILLKIKNHKRLPLSTNENNNIMNYIYRLIKNDN